MQGADKGNIRMSTNVNQPTVEGEVLKPDDGKILFKFSRKSGLTTLSKLHIKQISCPLTECQGNCMSDEDCVDELKCFIRTADITSEVQGCIKGGPMDKPDFNYCYNPTRKPVVDDLRFRVEDQCTNRALISSGSMLGK